MSFSDVQDSVLNTRNFTEYEYDAFGRRIETRQYLGDYTRNLYDGFSFDIIGKSVLQGSYPMALPEQKYRTPNRQSATSVTGSGTSPSGRNERGTDIDTRYRYIDDTPLVPIQEAGNNTNSSVSANGTKTRSRPNNEYVLYSYGEPVAIYNDNGTSYFGTDILGSVRSVTDKYGAVQADYSYDVFGNPYLGNLENNIGFGYCGKVYDVGTGLYDYGFRDYSPVSARFTTVDPVRDGANWFAYVVNDPVNWCDPFGLSATDSKSGGIIFSNDVFKNTNYGFTDFEFTAPTESNNNNTGSGYTLNAPGSSAVAGFSLGVGPYNSSQKNNGFSFANGAVLGHNDVYIGWQNEESRSSKLIKQGSIEFFIGMLLDNGAPFIGAAFAPVTGGSSIYAVPAIKAFGIVLQVDGAAKITSGSILAAVEEGSGGGKNGKKIKGNGNKGNELSQSAKDANKIDGNAEANKFARNKGYGDAHDLKEAYVGKKDVAKFDIYVNSTTKEEFLINKSKTIAIPIN